MPKDALPIPSLGNSLLHVFSSPFPEKEKEINL